MTWPDMREMSSHWARSMDRADAGVQTRRFADPRVLSVVNQLEGEQLLVHRFAGRTLGLVPSLQKVPCPANLPAVCVPPGARLLLRDIPEHLRERLGVGSAEEVVFVQKGLEAFTHRDAVRFANGQEILLQHLQCGQRVDVVSLGGGQREPEHQRPEEEYRHLFIGPEWVVSV